MPTELGYTASEVRELFKDMFFPVDVQSVGNYFIPVSHNKPEGIQVFQWVREYFQEVFRYQNHRDYRMEVEQSGEICIYEDGKRFLEMKHTTCVWYRTSIFSSINCKYVALNSSKKNSELSSKIYNYIR